MSSAVPIGANAPRPAHDDRARWNGTSATGRTVANAVLVSAGLAAGYLILTRPPLRRLAMVALRVWLGTSVPAYLLSTARRAWVESGPVGLR